MLTDEEKRIRRNAYMRAWMRKRFASHPPDADAKARKLEVQRVWRATNPDKYKARKAKDDRLFYQRHTEKIKAQNAAWRAANPERVEQASAAWRAAHPEIVLEYSRAHRRKDPEREKERRRLEYQANAVEAKANAKAWCEANPEQAKATRRAWKQANHGRVIAAVKTRKADKLRRTPSWADLEAIARFYAARPDGYHVDHIVPLRGRHVSGLHVHYNLQYLPAVENLRKANTNLS